MIQVDKNLPRSFAYSDVTADARLNSFYTPSYVHIETQYSPSTSPVAKPREHSSTYTPHDLILVYQHFELSTPIPAP
jgi:hypothetical protein